VLFSLREHTKALEALDVASEQDEAAGSKSAREIQELSYKIQSANSAQRANETEQETMERAMRDPEIAVRLSRSNIILVAATDEVDSLPVTGNHDRSCDAKHLAAGADQPASIAGPHEEPDSAE